MFNISAKRVSEFKDFQNYCDVEERKILRLALTRWLLRLQCVKRILNQWSPLLLYFTEASLTDNNVQSKFLYQMLSIKLTKIYFHFLDHTLEHIQMFNLVFQSEDTTLHLHYRLAENLFETILRYYMQSDYVDAFKNGKFNQINPSESDQYLPLKVNIGEEKDNLKNFFKFINTYIKY